jgi:hypothetical protein
MDERVIDRIIYLHWIVRDVAQSNRPLLIGDAPFERIGSLYQPRTLISIPLTPAHVFFGTDAADVVNRITAWTDRQVVNSSNVSSVSTAKRYVYGEAESRFIERERVPPAGLSAHPLISAISIAAAVTFWT